MNEWLPACYAKTFFHHLSRSKCSLCLSELIWDTLMERQKCHHHNYTMDLPSLSHSSVGHSQSNRQGLQFSLSYCHSLTFAQGYIRCPFSGFDPRPSDHGATTLPTELSKPLINDSKLDNVIRVVQHFG